MPILNKSNFIFAGEAVAGDYAGGTPRPGSAGTQSASLDLVAAGHNGGSPISLLYPSTASVDTVDESHLEYWVKGTVAAGFAVVAPAMKAPNPVGAPQTANSVSTYYPVAALGAGTTLILSGPLGAGKIIGARLPSVTDWQNVKANCKAQGGGVRSHSEIYNSDAGEFMSMGDTVDLRGSIAPIVNTPGVSGFVLFGDGSGAQTLQLDDLSHTDIVDFPTAQHIAAGEVIVGYEGSDWVRNFIIGIVTPTFEVPSFPVTAAGSRPGGSGTNKLNVSLETQDQFNLAHPHFCVRDTGFKDFEVEQWFELPASLPDTSTKVKILGIIADLANAGEGEEFALEFVVDSGGNITGNLLRGEGGNNDTVLATTAVGSTAGGNWVGLRLRVKQFGLTAIEIDSSWNNNGGGWNPIGALSVVDPKRTGTVFAVNQGTKTFTLNYDGGNGVVAMYPATKTFTISGSTGNDGTYTIVSAVVNGSNIDVTVSEVIPDPTADGNFAITDYTSLYKAYMGGIFVTAQGTNGPWVVGFDDYRVQEF